MAENDSEGSLTTAPIQGVARVAFRPPPFWESNPELWFGQLESQFHISGITADVTKFHSVVAALDSNVLSCATDLVRTPPTEKLYETLKKRILSQYVQSDSARLKHLLQDLFLGDKRPSQLLLEMRNLADGKISDVVMKSLWLQRLPVPIQQILSVSSETLDGLAKVADKVNEVSGCTIGISSVSHTENSELKSLKDDIASLRADMKRLTTYSKNRSRSRSRGRTTSRDSSNNRPETETLCWYHRRFGKKARSCFEPCNFSENI